MAAEVIIALTPVLIAIISAFTAWQGKKIRELSSKFDKLNSQFRSAVWHIRDWPRWDRNGRTGDNPALPNDPLNEV